MLSANLLLLGPIYMEHSRLELLVEIECVWGEDPLFKRTGVSALSLRLTSCHQILISSPQLSSQQQAKGNS